MYKLWNFLFGWDYVYCSPIGDKAIRIRKDIYGNPYIKARDCGVERVDSTDLAWIIWLTCRADKYINTEYKSKHDHPVDIPKKPHEDVKDRCKGDIDTKLDDIQDLLEDDKWMTNETMTSGTMTFEFDGHRNINITLPFDIKEQVDELIDQGKAV